MATRATTFSARIRTLHDYHARIAASGQWQHVAAAGASPGMQQPPSSLEIVNTLRYFQQTLVGFLKEIPRDTLGEACRRQSGELSRGPYLPTCNYTGLYYALCNLIDVFPMVPSGHIALGHSLLVTLKILYLFLDRDSIDQMPFNAACLLCTFPKELHTEIMQLLCDVLLPFTLADEERSTYATSSIPAVILLVFQYSAEPHHHTWLLETLMALRRNVYQDVLTVIACGTSEARVPAANLLFHYWPLLNPHVLDRKPVQYRAHAWTPTRCQHRDCCSGGGPNAAQTAPGGASGAPGAGSGAAGDRAPARESLGANARSNTQSDLVGAPDAVSAAISVKKVYEPAVCATVSDTAPPVLLCKACADDVAEEYNKVTMAHACQPMATTNVNVCQNKGCLSTSRVAVATCFSEDCVRPHGHVPIRLCAECHDTFHAHKELGGQTDTGGAPPQPHIFHTRLPHVWHASVKVARDTIEAIVKLLKETSFQLESSATEEKRPKWVRKLEAGQAIGAEVDQMADEKRMLSRYGVWMLAGLCTPEAQAPPEAIGYLMSMVFQWFGVTALLPNDAMGAALEQLKTDFVCDWLQAAINQYYEVFIQCLLPRPPEYAKVAGLWDKLAPRRDQIKEGLNRVLALVPYDIISYKAWDTVMPEWLEAVCNEVSENDLHELKVLLCKLFEPDLCTMTFSVEQTYHFIGRRLADGSITEQQKALDWLLVLSQCEIAIPLDVVFKQLRCAAERAAVLYPPARRPSAASGAAAAAASKSAARRRRKAKESSAASAAAAHPIIVSRVDSIGDVEGLFDETESLDGGRQDASATGLLTPEGSPMRKPLPPESAMMHEDGEQSNVMMYVSMLEIILLQVELAEMSPHRGFNDSASRDALQTITSVVRAPRVGEHSCGQPDTDDYVDCNTCQEMLILSQVLLDVLERFCPRAEIRLEMADDADADFDYAHELDTSRDDEHAAAAAAAAATAAAASAGKRHKAPGVVPRTDSQGQPQPQLGHMHQLKTANVQEEQMEFVGILPTENVETAVAEATTLTETDVGLAKCSVATAQLVPVPDPVKDPVKCKRPCKMSGVRVWDCPQVGRKGDSATPSPTDAAAAQRGDATAKKHGKVFWYTSVGKFVFRLEDLPAELQMVYAIMNDIEDNPDPDVVYFLLHCLKYLCLHAEALKIAHKDEKGFLIWAQEHLLGPKIWQLVRSDFSQLSQIGVPLLLHCLTLPMGADAFWTAVTDDMTSRDWNVRFRAVGKITQMGMFVDATLIKANVLLQGALANAFSLLIAAVHDPNAAVAQRALMSLDVIRPAALKCLIWCMEAQFDACIVDSVPLVLPPHCTALCWELQRRDIAFGDVYNTDPLSDIYQRKVARCRRALEAADSVKSMVRFSQNKAMPHQVPVPHPVKCSVKVRVRDCPQKELTFAFAQQHQEAAGAAGAAGNAAKSGSVLLKPVAPILPCSPSTISIHSYHHHGSSGKAAGKSPTLGGSTATSRSRNSPCSSCSMDNDAAVACRRKINKVVTMVRVVNAWRLMRRKMSTNSWGSLLERRAPQTPPPASTACAVAFTVAVDPASATQIAHEPTARVSKFTLGRINSSDSASPCDTAITSVYTEKEEAQCNVGTSKLLLPGYVPVTPASTPTPLGIAAGRTAFLGSSFYNRHRDANYGRVPGGRAESSPPNVSHRGSTMDAEGMLGRLREFTDHESNFCLSLSKAIDAHASEKHTLFLSVSLFMRFLSMPTTVLVSADEKAAAKKQNTVFRHLNVLLGYSNSESCFTIPPHKLRAAPAVNAYLGLVHLPGSFAGSGTAQMGLPAVLDRNLQMGNYLMPVALQLLQYLPSPQRFASDNQPLNYSLAAMTPVARHQCLWILLLLLYKYNFNKEPLDDVVRNVVLLLLNTIEAQAHRCDKLVDADRQPQLFAASNTAELAYSGAYQSPGGSGQPGGGDEPLWPAAESPRLRKAATAIGTLSAQGSRRSSRGGGGMTPSAETASISSHINKSMRALVNKVLLMVRVVNSWPRPSHSAGSGKSDSPLFEPAAGGRQSARGKVSQRTQHALAAPTAFGAIATVSSDAAASRSEQQLQRGNDSSSSCDETSELVSSGGNRRHVQAPRHQRKKRHHAKFDMRAHMVEAVAMVHSDAGSDAAATGGGVSSSSGSGARPVESRIRQQIDEFDRSFGRSAAGGDAVSSHPLGDLPPPHAKKSLMSPPPPPARRSRRWSVSLGAPALSRTARAPVHAAAPPPDDPGDQVWECPQHDPEHRLHAISEEAAPPVRRVSLAAPMANTCASAGLLSPTSGGGAGAGRKLSAGANAPVPNMADRDARRKRIDAVRERWHSVSSSGLPPMPDVSSGDSLSLRCGRCNAHLEHLDEETLNLCVICLETFVEREPAMAADLLPRMLQAVARLAQVAQHDWQAESNVFVPGNNRSVCRQMLRVVLHQLSPNSLFLQLFQSDLRERGFFKAISASLADFQELTPVNLLQILLEDVQSHWVTCMRRFVFNLCQYVLTLSPDPQAPWPAVVALLDAFVRRYAQDATKERLQADFEDLPIIMNFFLRLPGFGQMKGSSSLADGFAKVVSLAMEMTPVKLVDLLNICSACNRAFVKERDRLCIARACINQLLQALKFKITLPEANYMMLLNLMLQDCGEVVPGAEWLDEHLYSTGAAECAKPYVEDMVAFIADLHVLNRIKLVAREGRFREDTLGGDLKAALSQYVAVEIGKGNYRDPRTVLRYLPWLLTPPSVTQQGPAEFVECVAHVRVLSWVLLGALQSSAPASASGGTAVAADSLPVPIDASQQIADQIQFVLAGFAEQSKESVEHMSALFHAFHLCQLWTVYCEQLADMVNLHFLNAIEALQQCESTILTQLYPMWHPILSAYHSVVPNQLRVRLDAHENAVPCATGDAPLEPWLKRVRYKISQVELQSSAATQIYSV